MHSSVVEHQTRLILEVLGQISGVSICLLPRKSVIRKAEPDFEIFLVELVRLDLRSISTSWCNALDYGTR
jgi:hypothetical protein